MVHSVIVRKALLKFRNGRTAKTITVENCLERRRHGAYLPIVRIIDR